MYNTLLQASKSGIHAVPGSTCDEVSGYDYDAIGGEFVAGTRVEKNVADVGS